MLGMILERPAKNSPEWLNGDSFAKESGLNLLHSNVRDQMVFIAKAL